MEKEYKIVISESNSQMAIDSLLDILSKQNNLIQQLEASKKELSDACSKLKNDSEDLNQFKIKVARIESDLNGANYLVNKYKEEINILNKEKQSLSEACSDKGQVEAEFNIFKQNFDTLQQRNADLLKDIETIKQESTQTNYLISLKEDELKEVKKKLKDAETNNAKLSDKNKELSDVKNGLEKELAELKQQKEKLTEQKSKAEEEVEKHSQQIEIQSKQKFNYLVSILNKIRLILDSEVETIQNDWLKVYVTDILTCGTSDVPSLRQIETLEATHVVNLVSYGNTSITKLANLVWWYTWSELKDIIDEIPSMNKIDFYYREVLLSYLKTFYNIDVHMPDVSLDANLNNYEKDTRTPTILKNLKTENFSIKNNTKCEISTLSYNDNFGICYVAYEIGN